MMLLQKQSSSIGAVKWKKNKVVTLVSTYCGVAPLETNNALGYQKQKKLKSKIVEVYIKRMESVDRLAVYIVNHRSKKWWWPIICFCIDVALYNAFHLYRVLFRNPAAKML